MKRSRWSIVALSVLLPACASEPFPTAPDRPLFRLATTGVAEGAVAEKPRRAPTAPELVPLADVVSFNAPPRSTRVIYTTSIRIVRPDGTILTAPRVSAWAGQHANIQILQQTAYVQDFDIETVGGAFVADPVIGMLHEGAWLDFVVLPAAGADGEAAVGMSVRSAAVRKPIGTREFEVACVRDAAPVTIQTPRTERVEVTGAQRLRLGEETEWARVPDPAGGEDLRILGRVVMSDPLVFEADEPPADVAADEKPPSPDETFLGKGVRVAKPAPEPDRSETMRRLADAAAAAGARLGTLRVTAVQVPAGAAGADATGVVRLGEVSVRTVPGEGVRLADTLSEAHLSDWEVDMGTGALSSDPIVSAAVSGLEADVAADGTLRLRWTTVARFGEFETTLGYYEDPVSLDVPEATSALRTVALAPGRAVHPMFKLADGGTAAIVVEFTPDQPR